MDKETKDALLKLANGYTYENRRVIADKEGTAKQVIVTKKHVPPSIKAMQMIENLKMSGKW